MQTETLLEIASVIEHAAGLAVASQQARYRAEIDRFGPAIRDLAAIVAELLPPSERALYDERSCPICRRRSAASARRAQSAGVIFLTTALEVGELAARAGQPIARAAQTFYQVGARFALDELRDTARRLPAETAWQKAAVATLIDDFYGLQSRSRRTDPAGRRAARTIRSPPGRRRMPPRLPRPTPSAAICAPPAPPI